MNPRQLRDNRRLREKLAAEYALGTLRGGARRRFEVWLVEDATLKQTVAEWQDRLHPLAEFVAPVPPPAQTWQDLERRLGLRPPPRRSFWLGLREDLSFWRGLGMVSTALATILLTVLLTRLPEPGAPAVSYVAMLADDHAQPAMVITGDAGRRQLTVKLLSTPALAADRSLELWAVPLQGAPRSLGVLAAGDSVILPLPPDATPASTPVLAVSLEPKGGSPTRNAPSGPIIYKGAWLSTT
jgi:anti-sigma-K factor RskA